jgi:hypothetical protein
MIHCLFAMEESKVSFPTQPLWTKLYPSKNDIPKN